MMSRHSTCPGGSQGSGRAARWTPTPAGPGSTHGAILQPLLEAVPARCRLRDIPATLRQDPPHQHLLQLRVVLPVYLLLHLPAQAVRRSPVCHADGRGGSAEIGPPSAAPMALEHPAWDRYDPMPAVTWNPSGTGGDSRHRSCSPAVWQSPILPGQAASTSGTQPYRPCQALSALPCPACFLLSRPRAGTGSVPTRG